MSNRVILKKSSVVNKIPTTADLAYGELAINYADGKLYFKNVNNEIDSFDTGGGGGAATGSPYLDAGIITEPINISAIDGGTIA
jgi:hypothetical protein